jgi:hypothetical protein
LPGVSGRSRRDCSARDWYWELGAEQLLGDRQRALRPHIERCIKAGRTSSSAIATDLNARGIAASYGGQWFPMQVRRVRNHLGL